MNQVYLAGRWSRREELAAYAHRLRHGGYGVRVVARWLSDPEHRIAAVVEGGTPAPDAEVQAFNARLANHDLEDVMEASAVILFSQPEQGARGGCWVEFGLALAASVYDGGATQVILVGPRSNVFTYLPEVTVFPDPDALFGALDSGELVL